MIKMSEEKMAEEHWRFLEHWLHIIYCDTFVHGFGHGKEHVLNEVRELYEKGLITYDGWEIIRREIEK